MDLLQKKYSKYPLKYVPAYAAVVLILVSFTVFKNKQDGTRNMPRLYRNNLAAIDSLPDPRLKVTLPKKGILNNGKPMGKDWVNLIQSLEGWNADANYWSLANAVLHGDYPGGQLHNYAWTKKQYKDFELQALVRLDGKDANSGVCIRLHPTDVDNAPGYQVDMGPGYWGSLWEERRAGMVQKFPDELVPKLVKDKDWNHYYVIAEGHHIQAWLNGVKTIDTVHTAGFEEGAIGFQLCHGDKHTILDVKSLYIKEIKQ